MLEQRLLQSPREGSGGSVASGRLEYQLDVALCLLLEAHEGGDDYVVLLDHHDDVVVCDSSTQPRVAQFYQVKTKRSGHWNKSELTQARSRAGAAPPNSYLGKLYHHRVLFQDGCGSLTFLSNCPFKLRLVGQQRAEVHVSVACRDLHVTETQYFVGKLKEELGLEDVPDLGQLASFKQSVLHLDAHEEQAKGRLVTFLETCAPGRPLKPSLVFRSLKGELRRRNNTEARGGDFPELSEAKGISRNVFQGMIDLYLSASDPAEKWRTIHTSLENARLPFAKIREFRRAYIDLDAQLLDPANFALNECLSAAQAVADTLPETLSGPLEVLEAIASGIAPDAERHLLDNPTRAALALRVMYP